MLTFALNISSNANLSSLSRSNQNSDISFFWSFIYLDFNFLFNGPFKLSFYGSRFASTSFHRSCKQFSLSVLHSFDRSFKVSFYWIQTFLSTNIFRQLIQATFDHSFILRSDAFCSPRFIHSLILQKMFDRVTDKKKLWKNDQRNSE